MKMIWSTLHSQTLCLTIVFWEFERFFWWHVESHLNTNILIWKYLECHPSVRKISDSNWNSLNQYKQITTRSCKQHTILLQKNFTEFLLNYQQVRLYSNDQAEHKVNHNKLYRKCYFTLHLSIGWCSFRASQITRSKISINFRADATPPRRHQGYDARTCYSSIARDDTTGHSSYPTTMETQEFIFINMAAE
jgi:hypothetical protein